MFADISRYRGFLLALLTAHARLGLDAARLRNAEVDGLEEERRIHALGTDLDMATLWRDPARVSQPLRMSRDYAWGVGYVLNGSALGAAVIMKAGHLGPTWPVRYLGLARDYARSGNLKAFFDALNEQTLDRAQALRGAVAVFDLLSIDASSRLPIPVGELRDA